MQEQEKGQKDTFNVKQTQDGLKDKITCKSNKVG
jgi:hypothetical protein